MSTRLANTVRIISDAVERGTVPRMTAWEVYSLALAVAPEEVEVVDYSTHDGRVQAALNSVDIMESMKARKKINAIKDLRALTSCGLKEAKDAVEDRRVLDAANWDYRPY